MSNDKRRRVLGVVLALAVVAAAITYLALSSVGENLVYYWSPSEMNQEGDKAVGSVVRLGGLVEPGSIDRGSDGLTLRFAVTDGEQSVPVYAEAVPPAMFREGIGVVLEGRMGEDGVFKTNRLMVKHDNQYQAPGDDETPDMEQMMRSLQLEDGGE
jgi:cytochrome c-type biogenesis protein CcmE